MYQTPTRFTKGVTNAAPFPYSVLGNFTMPIPMAESTDFDDFMNTYTAAQWTVTAVGAGSVADAAGPGGNLLFSTAGANNDLEAIQRPTAKFAVVAGSQVWFAANLKVSDATASQCIAGLVDTLATMAPASGIYFDKPAGATTLNVVVKQGGTATTVAIATNIANATSFAVGFYYDGKPTPTLYVFCSAGLTSPVAFGQAPFPGGGLVATFGANSANSLANVPTGNLVMGAGVKAGAAAVKTMTLDYLFAAADVVRF